MKPSSVEGNSLSHWRRGWRTCRELVWVSTLHVVCEEGGVEEAFIAMSALKDKRQTERFQTGLLQN